MTKVVHCQKESYDIYIGRPSIWGNPFTAKNDISRSEAIERYRNWILYDPEAESLRSNIYTLKDKTLGCWCKPKPCHGDVLVEIINNNILDFL